jgi:hypothetical protein
LSFSGDLSIRLFVLSDCRFVFYWGDRVGEGLSSGVYFLKAENRKSEPFRIVKVR